MPHFPWHYTCSGICDCSVGSETGTKLSRLVKQTNKVRRVFSQRYLEALFGPCETVAKVLQGEKGQLLVRLWKDTYMSYVAKRLWKKSKALAAAHNIKMPGHSRWGHTDGHIWICKLGTYIHPEWLVPLVSCCLLKVGKCVFIIFLAAVKAHFGLGYIWVCCKFQMLYVFTV